MAKGEVRIPNDVVDDLGYGEELSAWVWLERTRDYETNQPLISVRKLAQITGWSRSKAGRFHKEYTRDRCGTDVGQEWDESGTDNPPQSTLSDDSWDESGTDVGQMWDKNGTHNKESKNQVTKKQLKTKQPLLAGEFEIFWKAYPKTNASKSKTLEVFKKTSFPSLDELLEALRLQIQEKKLKDAAGIFHPEFPFPQKWLNQKRWENKPDLEAIQTETAGRLQPKPFRQQEEEADAERIRRRNERLATSQALAQDASELSRVVLLEDSGGD